MATVCLRDQVGTFWEAPYCPRCQSYSLVALPLTVLSKSWENARFVSARDRLDRTAVGGGRGVWRGYRTVFMVGQSAVRDRQFGVRQAGMLLPLVSCQVPTTPHGASNHLGADKVTKRRHFRGG